MNLQSFKTGLFRKSTKFMPNKKEIAQIKNPLYIVGGKKCHLK
jgi:hypothetical protein